ncbi:MAG TPA: 50S ribosomal protein L23 [Candidatus Paceibacterota bacterium]|nr:50S ribosomal protein L23 [Candidatus Paceibacterota bacterium]
MIKKPKTTEKAIRLIEGENTLIFEIDKKDTKDKVSNEVEKMFNVKVDRVNILNEGVKKIAYVKLNKQNVAIDVATKIGMI